VLSYQWLRDGSALSGATGASYTLTAADTGTTLSLAVSYTDGLGFAERLQVGLTVQAGDADADGVRNSVEDRAPVLLPGGLVGDGNGDGKLDSQQANVSSYELVRPSGLGRATFVTLVADAKRGVEDISDGNSAVIRNFKADIAPDNLPAQFNLPSLLSFSADVGTPGLSATFSIFVDPSLSANGYWIKDRAGIWINIATAIETVGGKVRIDFTMVDGGPFDADGVANGVIVNLGGAGNMPVGLIGETPDAGRGGFWF
jgi:hypothetical protein